MLLAVAAWGLTACSHEDDPDAGACTAARGDTAEAALLDAAPRAHVIRTDHLTPGAVTLEVRGEEQPYVVAQDDEGWRVLTGPGCDSLSCPELKAALKDAEAASHDIPDQGLAFATNVACSG